MSEIMTPKAPQDLAQIKAKLTELREDLFTLANEFALGENGLPKNGAVAVCLHKMNNEIGRALKALDDPNFTEELSSYHLHEHAVRTTLEIRGVLPRL